MPIKLIKILRMIFRSVNPVMCGVVVHGRLDYAPLNIKISIITGAGRLGKLSLPSIRR